MPVATLALSGCYRKVWAATDMTTVKHATHYRAAGIILGILSIALLFGSFCVTLYFPQSYLGALLYIVVGMVLGNAAIKNFGIYIQLKPSNVIAIKPETETFSASFKNGNPIKVFIQFDYPSQNDGPHVMPMLRAHLQRTFNMYLSRIDELSSEPYKEIDQLLDAQRQTPVSELNLGFLRFKTINIEASGKTFTKSEGIYFKTYDLTGLLYQVEC